MFLFKILRKIPSLSEKVVTQIFFNPSRIKKFIKMSERKNYYHDGEDAILMHYKN